VAETVIALRDIAVEYGGFTALQIPSFDIQSSEVLALIGPNGAGKSTLLRIAGLLQYPSAGKVYFRNEQVNRKNSMGFRRRVASVFQEPLLLNTSVYDNAALGLRLRGLDRAKIERLLRPWLDRLGIGHLASRPVRTLSGGEAQRTSLARAFVLEPEVLLLDEPFSPLDPLSRESLLDDLQRILRETRITTVFVTHDRHEAFAMANRVGVLHDGRLVQLGPAADVFAHPLTEQVADTVGIENRIGGLVESFDGGIATVRIEEGKLEAKAVSAPGSRVILCVRSEHVQVSCLDKQFGSANAVNELRAKITRVTPGMTHCRVTLRCGKTVLVARIDPNSLISFDPREGEDVVVRLDPRTIHVIGPSDAPTSGMAL